MTDQRDRVEHFEHDLDDPPPSTLRPVYVDAVVRDHEQRPIIPAAYRGHNLRVTTQRAAARTGHRIGYHLVRLPVYTALTAGYAVRGVGVVARRQVRWAWVTEQTSLRQHAAKGGDVTGWLQLHNSLLPVRKNRLMLLGVELVTVPAAAAAVVWLAPWWAAALVIAGLAIPLARAGKPVGQQIVAPAIVAHRYRKLTSDVVLRAYYAAGLGHPDKPDKQISFGSVMSRDAQNMGSQVMVDVPFGTTFADVVARKDKIASGLDVTEFQVYLTRDKTSTRRHQLFVADQNPLAIPAGRTPLLDLKPRDVWTAMPFGLDERGRKVLIELMWRSWLIGAQPRKGKTYSARLLALFAALDPYVLIDVVDGKNSPDWQSFRLVANSLILGTHPTGSGDPLDQLLYLLRAIKRDIQDRNDKLRSLPVSICPDGKLTREIARDRRFGMPVRMLVMEEFQVYFETEDQEVNKEVAQLLSFIIAVGPSAGVILLSSSQKPSGVGAGDVARLFNRYRDNHAVRFALRCGNRLVSEAVLGGDAYSEGYDASSLPVGDEYRGIGYLYGLTDETPIVRTYLADAADAEKILSAARRIREQVGTLTGMAAGETTTVVRRDFLADVYETYVDGEAWQSWQLVASRLAERWPDAYAEITAEAVSAQVRAFGVESRNGKTANGQVLKGPKRAEVELAIERRSLGGR